MEEKISAKTISVLVCKKSKFIQYEQKQILTFVLLFVKVSSQSVRNSLVFSNEMGQMAGSLI